MFDTLHEECGVFGAVNVPEAQWATYYGLHSLQHRGQEAGGISVCKGQEIETVKGKGLVIDIFTKDILDRMDGRYAIGHVRYSTAGGQEVENIQPIAGNGALGPVSVVHNGQIVNDKELRRELEEQGCIFQGTSDSEVLLHLIMKETGDLKERVKKTAEKLVGAFSFLVLQENRVIAVRDRWGLRPLSYARSGDGYVIASETCAFEVMGLYRSKTIEPGEIVDFDRGLVKTERYAKKEGRHLCSMELIYFARPDSDLDGLNVHAYRKETGKMLARKETLEADIVVPVPDSSISAAIGYAEESGIPMETGLVKNRFVTRTFIQPSQAMRDRGVRMKLSPVFDVIKDKRVVLVDDSIVRGTTSKRIVSLLKEAGAREVHLRIASPRLISPCFYGVDISTKDELIACQMNNEEICEFTGADSLVFLDVNEVKEAGKSTGLCTACFDERYCTPLFSYEDKKQKKL